MHPREPGPDRVMLLIGCLLWRRRPHCRWSRVSGGRSNVLRYQQMPCHWRAPRPVTNASVWAVCGRGYRLSRSIIKFRPLRLRHLGPDKSPLAVEGNGGGFHRAGVPCSAEQQDRKQPPSAVHFELVCRSRFQRSNAPASVRLQAIKTALAGIHRQGDGKHRSCGLDRIGHRRPRC